MNKLNVKNFGEGPQQKWKKNWKIEKKKNILPTKLFFGLIWMVNIVSFNWESVAGFVIQATRRMEFVDGLGTEVLPGGCLSP